MTAHVELSDSERVEVLSFWRDYFYAGGHGLDPSAFQIDALNDRDVRDTLMWWQIGGTFKGGQVPADHRWYNLTDLFDALGAPPQPEQSLEALNSVVKLANERGVEADDTDLGTVFVLLHVEWLLLAGDFGDAIKELGHIGQSVFAMEAMGSPSPHRDPLSAMSTASVALYTRERQGTPLADLRAVAAEIFGMTVDDPAPAFAIRCSDKLRAAKVLLEERKTA